MLYLNIKRVARLRGIDNPYQLMVELGFAPVTARKFQGHSVMRINFEHLERLCLALNCTPNDILEWMPSETLIKPEEQALIKLKRHGEADVSKLLTKLPMEKYDQILELLQDLKDK